MSTWNPPSLLDLKDPKSREFHLTERIGYCQTTALGNRHAVPPCFPPTTLGAMKNPSLVRSAAARMSSRIPPSEATSCIGTHVKSVRTASSMAVAMGFPIVVQWNQGERARGSRGAGGLSCLPRHQKMHPFILYSWKSERHMLFRIQNEHDHGRQAIRALYCTVSTESAQSLRFPP